MTIYSMTGYGKGIAEKDGLKITVELKSVNHRFLDLNIKLPKVFSFAEDTLRKTMQSKVGRGHIDVYVNYEDNREDKDEKSALYEEFGHERVRFVEEGREGPAHRPSFTMALYIDGQFVARAKGDSKKEAEKECARSFFKNR